MGYMYIRLEIEILDNSLSERSFLPLFDPRMKQDITVIYRPLENCITARDASKAHALKPDSPPPSGNERSSSSLPGGSPTTTSALQVRKERMLSLEDFPRGPKAS